VTIATLPPQRFGVAITGHAALPGTGPAGETCGSCAAVIRHSRDRGKCGHPAGRNTRSNATDIRLSHPACRCWSAPK